MTTHRDIPIADIMPGVTITLAPGEMITTALCLAIVVPLEGDDRRPALAIAHTPGTDWITQRGMLHAALDIERGIGNIIDQEDEQ